MAVYDYKVKCGNPQVIHKVNDLTGHYDRYVVPCGKCFLCRMRQKREIAFRCMLEAQCCKRSYFMTLTYSQEPETLDYKDIQLFVKRLRKRGMKMKYLFCSDVGEMRGRKHWHGLVFIDDCSPPIDITDSWDLGFCDCRPCNDARVGYATGYAIKKVLHAELPTICHFSQRLGLDWCLKHLDKIKKDCCIWFGGLRYGLPRYFRKKIADDDSAWLAYYHNKLAEDLPNNDDVDFGLYVDSMRAENESRIMEYALKGKGVL